MKLKKSKNANLERRRGVFFRFGLLISLSVVLLAFEWSVSDATIDNFSSTTNMEIEEEMAELTARKEEPPPPKPEMQKVPDEIKVVDNKVIIDDPIPIFDITDTSDIPIVDLTPIDTLIEVIPFAVVENKPTFKGGDKALLEFLMKETKYPEMAVEGGISGIVYIEFVIDTDGKVIDVALMRGKHKLIDDEALRVVKKMPAWNPGSQRGKPVRVPYVVPVKFVLE